MTQKRIKGSTIFLVLLTVMLAVSLYLNAVAFLSGWVEKNMSHASVKHAEQIVAELDSMEAAGTLDQYDLSMAGIVGKPRMMTFKQVDATEHLMVTIGSEYSFVELYSVSEDAVMYSGQVFAARQVRASFPDGEDRWWVMDEELLLAYMAAE